MHISVVICTRNRPDLIGSAVRSVLASSYPSFDLLVVDQSSDDRTGRIVHELQSDYDNLRYVHTTLVGLSRAYNRGVDETNGEVIAFTDDDCVAPHGWLSSIADAFQQTSDADMLYGQVKVPDELRDAAGVIPALSIASMRRLSRRDGFKIYGMGANFAVRRSLMSRVGGFDEMLGGGGPLQSSQDFDFQYRVYLAGAVVLLCPYVWVDHYGLRNDVQWPATERAYGVGNGAFFLKHVRCGDWLAVKLLLLHLAWIFGREILEPIRKKGSRTDYLRGLLRGLRLSLSYGVDRRTRLYMPGS